MTVLETKSKIQTLEKRLELLQEELENEKLKGGVYECGGILFKEKDYRRIRSGDWYLRKSMTTGDVPCFSRTNYNNPAKSIILEPFEIMDEIMRQPETAHFQSKSELCNCYDCQEEKKGK